MNFYYQGKRLTRLSACLLALPCVLLAQDAKPQEDTEVLLDLLDLMNTPVTTATKTAVKLSDVPAAVTVITRQDIQVYGYQTLDQALSRVPEVYTHYEGHDTGADFRGFFANNVDRRVLYLLNGQRINDRFHFGDFVADTIQDLSNVERIEVIRGPGAALYGSVAVQGVVNIITRDIAKFSKDTGFSGSLAAADMSSGALTKKITLGFHHRWSKDVGLLVDLNWFDGEVMYDTRTAGLPRPWNSPYAESPGKVKAARSTDSYMSVPGSFAGGSDFSGGSKTPNFNIQLNAFDFTIGAFLQTHLATWVWPNATVWEIGNQDNIRSWGAGAFYVDWKPKFLEKLDFAARLSYNINTNREVADFGTDMFVLNTNGTPSTQSYFMARIGAMAGSSAIIGPNGETYKPSLAQFNVTSMSDAVANAHGGGGHTNYAGIDKSWGLDFQMSPLKTSAWLVSCGGNYEKADYYNKQWYNMRDGTFIGWTNSGGISDNGYYFGLWGQAIWTPIPALTFTGGARYDKQVVQDVHRQLGGDQMLYRLINGVYQEFRIKDKTSSDFTPRVAVNWRITDTSNLKVIYAQAFRAVPPQEIIRLPPDFGDAESEKTKDYEILYSTALSPFLNLSLNAFHLTGSVVYAWNASINPPGFNKGSGWSNTGLSADLKYLSKSGLEAWFNTSYYNLKRASDAFAFMRNYNANPTPATLSNAPALPNMDMALDSPTMLAKGGVSYHFDKGTTLSGELYYNGEITSLAPVNLNVGDPNPGGAQPNYLEHKVPASTSVNVAVRQDFEKLGIKGAFAQLKITNLLDAKVWGVLNMDMQGWGSNTTILKFDSPNYTKPTQLPGFGRLITLQIGYTF